MLLLTCLFYGKVLLQRRLFNRSNWGIRSRESDLCVQARYRKKEIYIDASTHVREHMTANVVMEMIDTYTAAYINEKKLYGYDVKKVLNTTSI